MLGLRLSGAARRAIDLNQLDTSQFTSRPVKRYFDRKKLAAYLRRRKADERRSEHLQRLKRVLPPLPDGWTTETFIRRVGFGDDETRSFVAAFKRWPDLALWNTEAVQQLGATPQRARDRLKRHVSLFLHGLWPPSPTELEPFQAPPLRRQGARWTAEEHDELLRLAELYDVSFGDPWLYISWKLQRPVRDVVNRYLRHVLIPANRASQFELCLAKAARPLRCNRHFRLDTPFIFIVPSVENYPPVPVSKSEDSGRRRLTATSAAAGTAGATGAIASVEPPAAFAAYLSPDCFDESRLTAPAAYWTLAASPAVGAGPIPPSEAPAVIAGAAPTSAHSNKKGSKWQEVILASKHFTRFKTGIPQKTFSGDDSVKLLPIEEVAVG